MSRAVDHLIVFGGVAMVWAVHTALTALRKRLATGATGPFVPAWSMPAGATGVSGVSEPCTGPIGATGPVFGAHEWETTRKGLADEIADEYAKLTGSPTARVIRKEHVR